MEEKTIIKIDLDNKRIGSKPLILQEYLSNVRKNIKSKVKECQFKFLDKNGKAINKENETFYKLINILYNDNIIKLQSDSLSEIKILMNNVKEITIKVSKEEKIKNIRNLIDGNFHQKFIFLDQDGIEIEEEDENDYKVKDIINNNEIKLSSSTFEDAPPVSFNNILNDDESNKKDTPFEKPTETKLQFYKLNEIVDHTFNNLITFHNIGKEKPLFINNIIDVKNLKKEKVIDFNKFEKFHSLDGITYYKYSKLETQKPKDSVYLNYYDKYSIEYDEEIAYVILFCGKTGDGKTTAINAFFNIIKGIKKEDKNRFILIEEPPKNQKDSQTDGVHLYFVKDAYDSPIIIIDSAGYADTRGQEYDEKISEAFNYIFSNLITHINCVGFIVKATDGRIGTEARYIFSCVTSLFAENINENFIVLATHANEDTILEGPSFIKSLEKEEDIKFLKLNERKDKWWYSFDSKTILNIREKKITEYSFDNLKEFYSNLKLLIKKDIKKSSELLQNRTELKSKAKILLNQFKELFNNQEKLQKQEDIIKEIENEIDKLPEDPTLEEINKLLTNINNLNTKVKTSRKRQNRDNNEHVTCTICQKNCHSPCDCFFRSFSRCHIYPFFSRLCEVCGHSKEDHTRNNRYYTEELIEEESPQIREQIEILKNILQKQKDFEILKKEDKLSQSQQRLGFFKEQKSNIEKAISEINKQIKCNVVTLKVLSERINKIAMNNNTYKAEEDYIDSLIYKLREANILSEDKIEGLKKMKSSLKIILEIIKERKEYLNLEESNFNEKIKNIIEINAEQF